MCEFFAVAFFRIKRMTFGFSGQHYSVHNSVIYDECQTQSAKVRALPRQLPDDSIDIAYASFKCPNEIFPLSGIHCTIDCGIPF